MTFPISGSTSLNTFAGNPSQPISGRRTAEHWRLCTPLKG